MAPRSVMHRWRFCSGYVSGVFSSRKLEEDVAFRVLAAGNFPSHRTICAFRKRHLKDFKTLFVQVVQIAGEAGLVSLGTLAVDGTKVRANASKHKAMSYKRDFGVPDDKAQSNFTDPESRIMKTNEGYQQCFNAQLAVDEDFQMIVATTLTSNASDQGVMLGVLDQVEDSLQARPDCVLADAGYRKEDDFVELERRGIDAYVSLGREGKADGEIDAEAYPATREMVAKLATPEGRERYRDRKHIVEAVNGWIKHVMGFRRFSLRGLAGASGEWDLVCLAANLRRMGPLIAFG